MKPSTSFIKFVLAGGVAALINILSRTAFGLYLGYSTSIVLAFFVALSFAFFVNRRFVYIGATDSLSRQYGKFLAVNLLMLVQVAAVSWAVLLIVLPLISDRFYAETFAHALGVVSPVATSYLLHKHFTFRGRPIE